MAHRNITFLLIAMASSLVSCSLPDPCDEDSDGDGIGNCLDQCPQLPNIEFSEKDFMDNNCRCIDSDGDEVIDCFDPCPKQSYAVKTICGCGFEPEGEDAFTTCPEDSPVEDKCPGDSNKIEPGLCGCGVLDQVVYDKDEVKSAKSECPPYKIGADLCPLDDSKTEPGVCGCGSSDALVIFNGDQGDPHSECAFDAKVEDKCPFDVKQYPGVCGCGVEDSAQNLQDSDKDGIVDCIDKCPDNRFMTERIDGKCDFYDQDYDGVDDEIDHCPYNPKIQSEEDIKSKGYIDCNLRIEKNAENEDQLVYEVWTGEDLRDAMDELKKYVKNEEFVLKDYEYDIFDKHVQGDYCTASDYYEKNCTGISNSNMRTATVCQQDQGLGIPIFVIKKCLQCSQTLSCDSVAEIGKDFDYEYRNDEKRMIIRLMKDIDIYNALALKHPFGYGKWNSVNLFHTEFDGNSHTVTCTDGSKLVTINNPLFDRIIDSYVHDLNIEMNYQGGVMSSFAKHTFNSIVDNISEKSNILIQSAIFGEINYAYSYGHIYGYYDYKSAVFVGYAKASSFSNIYLNIDNLYDTSSASLSVFMIAADNIEASNIYLNYGSNDGKINITGSSYYSGLFQNSNLSSINNLYLNVESISVDNNTFNGIGKLDHIHNAWIIYKDVKATSAILLGDIDESENLYASFDRILRSNCPNDETLPDCQTSFPGVFKLIEGSKLDSFHINLPTATNKTKIPLNVASISNGSIEHGYFAINATEIHNTSILQDNTYNSALQNVSDIDHLAIALIDPMNTNDSLCNHLLTPIDGPSYCDVLFHPGEYQQRYFDCLKEKSFPLNMEAFCDTECTSIDKCYNCLNLNQREDYICGAYPSDCDITEDENIKSICVANHDIACGYDPDRNNVILNKCFDALIDQTESKPLSFIDCVFEIGLSIDITDTCNEVCNNDCESPEDCENLLAECIGCIDAYQWDICVLDCDDYTENAHNVCIKNQETVCHQEEYDWDNSLLILDNCMDTVSDQDQALYETCAEEFTEDCSSKLNIIDAYWYQPNKDVNAFCSGKLEPDEQKVVSCFEQQFTPFNGANAGDVASRLGKNWRTRTVSGVEIPWYYPDMSWVNTLKKEMNIPDSEFPEL